MAEDTSFNLVHPDAERYAEMLSSPEDALLAEIAEFTNRNHPEAIMLSGHLQGKVLEMISWMIRPRRVLEVGTFTGYSALCLARGLAPDGMLHTIELREADADIAEGYFRRSLFREKIILHRGPALEVIPGLGETWDLVFIDADKAGYIEYFNLVFPKLRTNGFILADNVFFHGHVLAAEPKGSNARAIRSFNEYIRNREDIDSVVLTVRDGLYLIRKL
ncbi:MAG TPA: O-methyltransferase [Chitinophagaceae bacterium]|nr:O-methyltransferase [Chitinophagaceae bacterium]